MPSILGIIGTFLMVVTVLWTHKIARILGPLWIAAWIAYYVRYRLKTNKPVFCNLQCNWDEEQPAILAGTGDRTMRPHPLGVLIALGFWGDIGHKRFQGMLRLLQTLPHEVAHAAYSVEAARTILVPILERFTANEPLSQHAGQEKHKTLPLCWLTSVEVLRLLTLDATLPAEINERSRKALKHERIAKWHGLRAVADIIRAREADEGTRCAVRAYQADLIVLSIQFSKNRVPSLFTRTADALVRRLSREMIIDSVLVG